MMAGMMRRVNKKSTRKDTMSEIAVLSIWVVVKPVKTVSSMTKSPSHEDSVVLELVLERP